MNTIQAGDSEYQDADAILKMRAVIHSVLNAFAIKIILLFSAGAERADCQRPANH